MNQRIRELVVRLVPDAFMTYKGYLYHSSDPKVFEHSDPEPLYTKQELVKFAELIVRECINKVRSRQMFSIEDEHNIHHAFDLLVYDLESYFGVEE